MASLGRLHDVMDCDRCAKRGRRNDRTMTTTDAPVLLRSRFTDYSRKTNASGPSRVICVARSLDRIRIMNCHPAMRTMYSQSCADSENFDPLPLSFSNCCCGSTLWRSRYANSPMAYLVLNAVCQPVKFGS